MILTCQDAAFAYDGATVISGLSFGVNNGDYLCVVGENGSGKSTLMKGLLRLKPPQSGQILWENGLRPNEVGYLPQQSAARGDFPASVWEIVLSGRLGQRGLRPFYNRADHAAAAESLRRLDILPLKRRCYYELSGGQQRRVLLARALCATQRLLLLDEPVAGLDPAVTAELYRLIEAVNRDMGLTIVMVSHDLPGAIRYASHILHLGGKQLFFGKTADYLRSEAARAFGGGDAHDRGLG